MTILKNALPFALVFTSIMLASHSSATSAEPAPLAPRLGLAFTELPPSIKQLRFAFACEDGLEVEARWVAQNVGKAAPPNHVIGTYKMVTRGPLNMVSLSRPNNGWPLGLYRLELVHDDKAFHVEYYVIEQAETE